MRMADTRLHYVYAVWAFLETAGYGGIFYGWGALVYVLKDEGLYRNICNVNETTKIKETNALHGRDTSHVISNTSFSYKNYHSCLAQDARLNLVFSVTSSFYCLAAFGLGQINYKYGTRVTRLTGTAMYILGALAVVFTSNEVPWLIFPGMCLIAGGGIGCLITNMQFAMLFPKAQSLLAGLFIGAFQFSSGVFRLMKYSYVKGISSHTSFLILGISHLLTLVSTFLFLPKGFIKKPPETPECGTEDGGHTQNPVKTLPPLRNLVFSSTYLLHLFWAAVLQLRFMFMISSLNVTLENLLGSKAEVSQYTNITAYILLGGMVVAPLVGAFYNCQTSRYTESISPLRRKLMPTVLPLALGTTSGVAVSAVVFARKPEIIYLVFTLLVFFRAFLFTMLTALLMAIYPSEYFGFLYGLNLVVSAVTNLLQYPLFYWGTLRNFQEVNLFLLVMTASTYIHPLYQWWTVHRAESRSEDEDSLYPADERNGYKTFGKSVD